MAAVAAVLTAAILFTAGLPGCTGLTVDITLTEDEINDALADSFPITESYVDILSVTLASPRAELTDGSDKMLVDLDAAVNLNVPVVDIDETVTGSVRVETGIGYNSSTGEIVLKEPGLLETSIDGIPDEYLEIATAVADDVLRLALDGFPIYKIEPEDFEATLASILVDDVRIEDGLLVVTLRF